VVTLVLFIFMTLLFCFSDFGPSRLSYSRTPTIAQTEGPMSHAAFLEWRSKAEGIHSDFFIHKEARNIRFSKWALGYRHEEFMKLEAPVEVCKQMARTLPFYHPDRGMESDKFRSTSHPKLDIENAELDLTWFDINNINTGIKMGQSGGSRIWIDTEKGILYYYNNW